MSADQIARHLASIATPGSFASRRSASPRDLQLEVDGLGPIRLPVSTATARKLCAVAQPARHGYREQTRLDRSVRDTWEIPAGRLKIDARTWQRTLQPQLAHIQRDLGLPEGARLQAKLHNLLVYAPGQFFVSHQDSEKTDAMIGTLVVSLPSRFRGGTMVVEHHESKLQVRGSASQLGFLAFYADCHHEVRPVTEGYRIVLTYNLLLAGDAAQSRPAGRIEPLAGLIREHFCTPPPPRWPKDSDRDVPDRFVYLLDHQYTQRGLAWNRLKNGDATRAVALQEVARQLDCEIFLALADAHETWDCESDGSDYRGRGWQAWDDEDEDQDENDEDDDSPRMARGAAKKRNMPDVTELIDSEIELRHFVGAGAHSHALASLVARQELCYTKLSRELEPFDSAHKGYMGNWGNTVEHWYHRAAVVMWPRARSFLIRARTDARWALEEIAPHLAAGDVAHARDLVRQLLPAWNGIVATQADAVTLKDVLPVAMRLEEPELARVLLAPFRLHMLGAKLAPPLATLLHQHGFEWTRALLQAWTADRRVMVESERMQWIGATLPALCRALCDAEGGDARMLACWMLDEQYAFLVAAIERLRAGTSERGLVAELPRSCATLLALVEGSRIARHDALHRAILDGLCATGDGLPVALGVLQKARDRHAGIALQALGLQSVHAHCVRELQALLGAPVRSADDWSITAPWPRCNCALCSTLSRFLVDPQQRRLDWPLAKDARMHVHRTIDLLDLPVTHATRRSGRPFTLQLEKTAALFAREAAARKACERQLAWLVNAAADFAAAATDAANPADARVTKRKASRGDQGATGTPRGKSARSERSRRG